MKVYKVGQVIEDHPLNLQHNIIVNNEHVTTKLVKPATVHSIIWSSANSEPKGYNIVDANGNFYYLSQSLASLKED